MKPAPAQIKAKRRCQSGQSSMEYAVVSLALALALGLDMASNDSVLRQLLDAFRLAYENLAFAISLPL